MRVILILWFLPLFLFWGWYFLSLNNIHFGLFFLTHAFHDHLFNIYGRILHMPAEDVPLALAWLFAIDSLIVLGIAALRWYKRWLPQSYAWIRAKLGFEKTQNEADVTDAENGNELPKMKVPEQTIGQAHPAE